MPRHSEHHILNEDKPAAFPLVESEDVTHACTREVSCGKRASHEKCRPFWSTQGLSTSECLRDNLVARHVWE